MQFIKEDTRIYCLDNDKKIIAQITFPEIKNGVYCIDHTFVDSSLRGQGIATKLVEMAVEEIKKKNGKVIATCLFAKKWLDKNNH